MKGLEVHAWHFDVKVFWLQAEQPVANAATDHPRSSDPTHCFQHVDQLGRKVHRRRRHVDAPGDLFKLVTAMQPQPTNNISPPSGVTGPSQRGPPSERAYSEPENIITPLAQKPTAKPAMREFGAATESPDRSATARIATACIKL